MHAAHTAAEEAKKKGCDSMLARFENGSIYRESQLAIGWDEAFFAHYDEEAKEDHSYVAAAEERKRREKSWVLALNSQGKMSGEGTRKSTPANKYGKERINCSQDPAKEQNESTRKLGILLQPRPTRLHRGCNHQTNGGRHRVGMNSGFLFLIPLVGCFAYRQWRFPCKRRGV